MVPDEKTVKIFQNTIIEFNQKTKNPRSLIAVHCTHGVNRTGINFFFFFFNLNFIFFLILKSFFFFFQKDI